MYSKKIIKIMFFIVLFFHILTISNPFKKVTQGENNVKKTRSTKNVIYILNKYIQRDKSGIQFIKSNPYKANIKKIHADLLIEGNKKPICFRNQIINNNKNVPFVVKNNTLGMQNNYITHRSNENNNNMNFYQESDVSFFSSRKSNKSNSLQVISSDYYMKKENDIKRKIKNIKNDIDGKKSLIVRYNQESEKNNIFVYIDSMHGYTKRDDLLESIFNSINQKKTQLEKLVKSLHTLKKIYNYTGSRENSIYIDK
jgi:hypothetical protein